MPVSKMKKCPTCRGRGLCADDTTCPTCRGRGEVPSAKPANRKPCWPAAEAEAGA